MTGCWSFLFCPPNHGQKSCYVITVLFGLMMRQMPSHVQHGPEWFCIFYIALAFLMPLFRSALALVYCCVSLDWKASLYFLLQLFLRGERSLLALTYQMSEDNHYCSHVVWHKQACKTIGDYSSCSVEHFVYLYIVHGLFLRLDNSWKRHLCVLELFTFFCFLHS